MPCVPASPVAPSQLGNSQSSFAGTPKGGVACSCLLCAKASSSDGSSPMLRCVPCANYVHTACLVTSHKNKGGVPLKNNLTWINEFIKSQNLFYCCSSCTRTALMENIFQPTLVAPVDSNIQASIDSKIADINKQVNDVLNAVRSLSSTKASMPADTMSSYDVASTTASSALHRMQRSFLATFQRL